MVYIHLLFQDVLSGMFSIPGIARVLGGPSCTPCLGITALLMSLAADLFMFFFLFVIFFPFMFLVVTFTPLAGLYIGWRHMEGADLKRYYLVRYLSGPFEAFPQAIVNVVYMWRTGLTTGTALVSLGFSLVSICQVLYQVSGVGKYCCKTGYMVFHGAGTFLEAIDHSEEVGDDGEGKEDDDEEKISSPRSVKL